jgi:hypothetical protein
MIFCVQKVHLKGVPDTNINPQGSGKKIMTKVKKLSLEVQKLSFKECQEWSKKLQEDNNKDNNKDNNTKSLEKISKIWKTFHQLDHVDSYSEGIAYVMRNGKYGFVNLDGNLIGDIKYESAGDYHEGRAWVMLGGMFGFINRDGNVVVDIKYRYESAGDYHESRAWVMLGGMFGFINRDGNVVVDIKYQSVGDYHKGRALVNNHYYIDLDGKPVLDDNSLLVTID